MRKYFYPIIVFVLMAVVIYLMGKVHWEIEATAQNIPGFSPFSPFGIALLKMSLLGFVFGILMNWEGLKTIYISKKIKLNYIFVLAIVTLVMALIPNYFWLVWFGLGSSGLTGFANALAFREIHLLISVLSGFLMIQSVIPESE